MRIFDSHAHYYDKKFEELDGGIEGLFSSFMPNPVEKIVNIGTNPKTSALAVEQAAKYDGMFAAVGIHPEDCHQIEDFDGAIRQIEDMVSTLGERKKRKIVAIGEIGLDYHYTNADGSPCDKEKEMRFFDAQMKLAEKYALPVIIHDREAHGDCFDEIRKYPNVGGVFHCYSGSAEMAKDLARRGWHLSFGGTLTFKNAERVREAARAVPKDRFLIETDAPYLAPTPRRGSVNHSGNLLFVLSTLAELWDCTKEEAAEITYQNAEKFFSI